MNPRLFFIPDVHGMASLLKRLLHTLTVVHHLDWDRDKVIFGGDYIDRGYESAEVINMIRNRVNNHPGQVIALGGNHEWLAIDAYIHGGEAMQLWMHNGGGPTQISYPNLRMPEEDIKWLASLPFYHREPGFFFSHAPVPKEKYRSLLHRGKEFTKAELTWTYHHDEAKVARDFREDDGEETIGVCGHIHAVGKGIFRPRFYPHYVFADAGCGCHPDAPLVAVELRSMDVIFASPQGRDHD